MNLTRIFLNITSVSLPTQWQITKAKRAYVKEHNECAVCGNKKYLEVHHCRPVHLFPKLACDPRNFITLCDAKNNSCHRWHGHFGNFKSKYNINIRELAIANRIIMINSGREELVESTHKLISDFSEALEIDIESLLTHVEELAISSDNLL